MVETELKSSNLKIAEMNSVKEKFDSSGDSVDCNEAVVATAPVFKQLLQGRYFVVKRKVIIIPRNLAHAEDAAVEDALYFLGESLRRGVLDCESFLKHVRNLSRYVGVTFHRFILNDAFCSGNSFFSVLQCRSVDRPEDCQLKKQNLKRQFILNIYILNLNSIQIKF